MPASNVENAFLKQLLAEGFRKDRRSFSEARDIEFTFGSEFGNVEVKMGNTQLVVQVSASVKAPRPTAPFEGLFHVTTDISSMASPRFENGTSGGHEKIMVSRMIEKSIVRSNAVDLESLCIVAGKRCWMLRADVHYLNFDGGLVDASCAGVIAALLHFRLPDTSIDGESVIIHDISERPPVPLSVLHVPIASTWVFVALELGEDEDVDSDESGDENKTEVGVRRVTLLDPTAAEQDLAHGEIIITANKNREICQVTKAGGLTLAPKDISAYAEAAFDRAVKITAQIQAGLKRDFETRNKGNLGNDLSKNALNVRAVA